MAARKARVYVESQQGLALLLNEPAGRDEGGGGLDTKSYSSRRSAGSGVLSVVSEAARPGSKKQFLSEQVALSKAREERAHEQIQKALALQRELQDKKLGALSAKVKESTSFLDQVDRELDLVNETNRTKTRRQFEEWNQNVHGNIQRSIAKKLDKVDKRDLHAKKLHDYQLFLDITNRKASIFRDIIIEAEYDPLEPNRSSIRAKTPKLKDPTQIDAQKADSEGGMLPPKGDGSKPKLCKETLPVPLWSKEKIGSTPYGMFAEMMEDQKETSELASRRRTKSSITWDDFNYVRGPEGRRVVEQEMPKGKPRDRKVYANPGAVYPFSDAVRQELLRIREPEPEDLYK